MDDNKTVHTDHQRTRFPKIMLMIVMRRVSCKNEAGTANSLQKDIVDMALTRMVCIWGCDEVFFLNTRRKELSLRCSFSPTSESFSHSTNEHYYFWLISLRLPSPHILLLIGSCSSPNDACEGCLFLSFLTYTNLSTRTGDRVAPDLTVNELSVCCSDPAYFFPIQKEGDEYLFI